MKRLDYRTSGSGFRFRADVLGFRVLGLRGLGCRAYRV